MDTHTTKLCKDIGDIRYDALINEKMKEVLGHEDVDDVNDKVRKTMDIGKNEEKLDNDI